MRKTGYTLEIRVTDPEPYDFPAIVAAVHAVCTVEDWWAGKYLANLRIVCNHHLSAGDTEDALGKRIVTAIWAVTGEPCAVAVRAVTYTQYEYGEAEFAKWKEGEPCA
jgi:hypothetical protein